MADLGEDWYDSEESTGAALVAELKRLRRRAQTRWPIVVIIAAVLTGAIYKKFATKAPLHEAQVVLAFTEESLSRTNRRSIPVDQLRDFVHSVLLPEKKLRAMIERRNLYPLRKQFGSDFAIAQLWEQTELAIWNNSFAFYEEGDQRTLRSARIGIAVTDTDPDRAFGIARDLAAIIIETATEQRTEIAETLTKEIGRVREALEARQNAIHAELAAKLFEIEEARQRDQKAIAEGLQLEVATLYQEQKRIGTRIGEITASSDTMADRIAAAGLEMSVEVVDEQPPDRTQPRAFIIVLVMVIVGFGALFGSALVVGAFDPRVHDTEDVERLNLPILGHVPGFPGDQVGSLAARGVRRTRVPLFRRWRSHR